MDNQTNPEASMAPKQQTEENMMMEDEETTGDTEFNIGSKGR
jgi:hypothetical protein